MAGKDGRLQLPSANDESLALAAACSAFPHDADLRLRLLETVFRRNPAAIMITDRDSRIVAVNPGFVRLTGFDAEEVLGRTPSMLKSGRHDAAFYRDMWRKLLADGDWNGEIWDRRKDGTHYPKWLSIMPRPVSASRFIRRTARTPTP